MPKLTYQFLYFFKPYVTRVEKSDSFQYLQTAQYRATCKQGAMPVLDSWYRAKGWHGTGIVCTSSVLRPSVARRKMDIEK